MLQNLSSAAVVIGALRDIMLVLCLPARLPTHPPYSDILYNSKILLLITSLMFTQMYQFSLNLYSLQQKFILMSNYLGAKTVIVKRVDCI